VPGAESPFVASLDASPVDDRPRLMMDWVAARVASFLGWSGPEDVAPDDHFVDDLGFDSLRAVDFKDVLESELGISVRTTALFDQPTPRELVAWLLDEVLAEQPEGASSDESFTDADEHGAPIAIIGMACRLPGGVTTPAELWSALKDGADLITEVPEDRWPMDRLYDPDVTTPGRMNTRCGGFVRDLDQFDAAFFGVSPREARQLDPQHRMLLEVAWTALEDAGLDADGLRGTDTGVFIGMRGSEYFDSQCDRGPLDGNQYYATGNAISTSAGRISYFLGLNGPSMAIDTACSASLVALHVACRSLRSGESGVAICGGVNAIIDAVSSISLSKAGMLSPDGRCKTFDASADGYGRAEGCGVVVLKPLDAALQDGDRVLAVIRGTAINQDGASGGLTVPSGSAQESVIRAALRDAGLRPAELQYIEAHGTGTSLGDPIELQSLDRVFGDAHADRPLLVGSVKTNLGHLETAAGISGLMKAVLAIRNGYIPPHLHLENPSPHIPWDDLRLSVPTDGAPWPEHGPRRAGISSFGFSGTNAHVIVEQAPPNPSRQPVPAGSLPMLKVSGKTPEARDALLDRWAALLERDPGTSLPSLIRSANLGRAEHPHRAALVAQDGEELLRQVTEARADTDAARGSLDHAPAHPPRVVWVFTGQGAQHPGMARQLYETAPAFRDTMDRCAAVFDQTREHPLFDVLWGDDTELLSRTDYTQPALFAVGAALADMWRSWGVTPSAVLGHSVGEYAAAYAAGVFSLEEGMRLIAARGALMVERCAPGAMLAVGMSRESAEELVLPRADSVAVAVVNGPQSVVISGDAAEVAALRAELAADGVKATELDVSHGFHSPLMDPMLDGFRSAARSVDFQPPRCSFISNLTGERVGERLTDPEYWVEHVRAPVRFVEGIEVLVEDADVVLELGPKPTLCALGRTCVPRPELRWVPSLRSGQADGSVLQRALAELWLSGAPIRWSGVYEGSVTEPVDVPTYPFQRQSFWLERGRGGSWRAVGDELVHPLLGSPVRAAVLGPGEWLFEARLDHRSPSWLEEHRVHGAAVVPAAVFVEMMLAGARHALASTDIRLENVAVEAPLLPGVAGVVVQTVVRPGEEGAVRLKVCSLQEDDWIDHATATASVGASIDPVDDPSTEGMDPLSVERFYDGYAELGLEYGPRFRAVADVARGDGAAVTALSVPEADDFGDWMVHPVLLDAAFQSSAAALGDAFDDVWLPVGMERVRVSAHGETTGRCRVLARPSEDTGRVITLDIQVVMPGGVPAVQVDGLKLVRAPRHALLKGADSLG